MEKKRHSGSHAFHETGADLVGRVLENRYKIEKLIGEGAMGYVYRGRQLRLRRTVAIKVPRPHLAADPDYLARFEREALTMAKCVHKNIVTIYDVNVGRGSEDITYLAMEFISGVDVNLFLLAEQDNITLGDVLNILKQLGDGIDAAHAVGIVHRDIKPANLVVTNPDRVAKIMDFGIAKGDLEQAYSTSDGISLGTPAFMAPEQIKGEDIGPYSDIYSFGMTFYKIFSRSLPYDATSTASLLLAQMKKKPIPLRWRNPAWPDSVEESIMRSISKDPSKRPGSAGELVKEISDSLQEQKSLPYSAFFRSLNQEAAPLRSVKGIFRKFQTSHIIAGAAILMAVAAFGLRLITRDAFNPPDLTQRPITENGQSGNAAGPDTQPVISENNDLPIIPEETMTPVPSPTPAIIPAAKSTDVSTPAPTPTPSEIKNITETAVAATPVRTPEETPTSTPAPVHTRTADKGIDWGDPAIWGAPLEGADRVIALKAIDRIFIEEIRRPLFRGQIRKAREPFWDVDSEKRERFFEKIREWSEQYENLTLNYIRESEKIDEEKAEIEITTGLTGEKRLSASGRSSEEITLVETFQAKVHFINRDGVWILVDWPSFL